VLYEYRWGLGRVLYEYRWGLGRVLYEYRGGLGRVVWWISGEGLLRRPKQLRGWSEV